LYQDVLVDERNTPDRKDPLIGRGSAGRLAAADDRDPSTTVDDRPRRPGAGAWSVPRPAPGRSPRDRPWSRLAEQTPGARRALGLALLAVLATAWMLVDQSSPDGPRPSVPASSSTSAPRPVRARTTPRIEAVVAVPHWVPDAIAATCRARRTEAPGTVVVTCTPARGVIALQYRGFSSVTTLRAAYTALAPRHGGDGVSRCSRGATEERAWSVSAAPTVATGRYRCSVVAGRARLVWSSEQTGAPVLAIASRADGDLRLLYQWWTTVPGPTGP
jgi:hypothetical protein